MRQGKGCVVRRAYLGGGCSAGCEGAEGGDETEEAHVGRWYDAGFGLDCLIVFEMMLVKALTR